MTEVDKVKYTKIINYQFDIKEKKIELTMEEILILQEAFRGILNNSNDKKIAFLD